MSFNIKTIGTDGAVGNHPDVTSWLNTISLVGGSASATTISALNTFCNSIDAAGLRNKFYRLNLFCGNNLASCLVPLYVNTVWNNPVLGFSIDTNNNFTSIDYNETGVNGGLLGDSSTKYLNTGFRTQDLPGVNNCHIAAWSRAATVNITRRAIGAIGTSSDIYFIDRRLGSAGGNHTRLGGSTNFGPGVDDFTTQSLIASRTSSTSAILYKNAVSIATQTTTLSGVTLTAQVFGVFTGLESGTVPNGFFPHRLCGYSIGAGLTGSDVTAFHNIWETFQITLERNT